MAIRVEKVSKRYGNQLALDNISLSINKGEIVGLLGPNGAGKSTLMKIISCFIPPSDGAVSVNGWDVLENPMEVRKLVGYLPENNPLYLDMYVREYLQFIAGIHHLGSNSQARIETLIDSTGLKTEIHKKIGALSKGYRQRVGIAQALMHDPEVLILDEPTSGLDPNQLVDIRSMIRSLGKDKIVILSTHIMQEVEAVCDRVVIMNNGVVVADDRTENITQKRESNVVVVDFDQKVSLTLLNKMTGLHQARQIKDNQWILNPKKDVDLRQELMQWAVSNKIGIQSMRQEALSMEEAFQQLTR